MVNPRRSAWAIVAVLVLTAGFYAVTLDYEYTWDDQLFYEKSPHLGRISNLPKTLSVDYWGLVTDPGSPEGSPYYRPLSLAFIVLERSLLGPSSPFPFRLLHTLVHLLNVLGVYFLSKRLLKQDWAAVFAAAVFAYLPYGVDTVLFLTSICDLLATSFVIGAALSFVGYLTGGRVIFLLGVVLASLLAVSSKENAIVLPFCLAAVFLSAPGGGTFRRGAIGTAASAICAALFLIARHRVVGGLTATSFLEWLKWLPSDIMMVLRWALAPFSLVLEQPVERELLGVTWWAGCLVLVLGAATCVFCYKRFPPVVTGIVLWGGTALPSLMALQWTGMFAPRYLYLPAVGLVIVLGFIFSVAHRYLKGLMVLLLVAAGYLAVQRAAEWQDRVTLFAMEIGREPESYTALSNLGNIFALAGERDKSIAFQLKAAEVARKRHQDCKAAFAYSNVGHLMGEGEAALGFFRRCTALCPEGSQNAWLGIARILSGRDRWKEAERAIVKAEEAGAERAEVFAQRALIATVLGKDKDAARCHEKVRLMEGDGSKMLTELDQRMAAARRYRERNGSQ